MLTNMTNSTGVDIYTDHQRGKKLIQVNTTTRAPLLNVFQ